MPLKYSRDIINRHWAEHLAEHSGNTVLCVLMVEHSEERWTLYSAEHWLKNLNTQRAKWLEQSNGHSRQTCKTFTGRQGRPFEKHSVAENYAKHWKENTRSVAIKYLAGRAFRAALNRIFKARCIEWSIRKKVLYWKEKNNRTLDWAFETHIVLPLAGH